MSNDSLNIYLYNVVFTDGSFLIINPDAKDEKDTFKSTLDLDKSTFYNSALIGDIETLIDDYNGYLYVQNHIFERVFKEVKCIQKYELKSVM